jgi:hypothetical protein
MGFVLANFNSWIQADLHSRDTTGFRRYMMKRMEGFMPELQQMYNTVKDLLDRCIEARPETTSRKIYSFGRKSRRPTKGKKHRYAIHDSRNKGVDTLPDEALRLISDYGGLYTAKSMADTSRKLANIYNIPGLVDEIQTHRTSMEECNMYKDTLRQVDHVMHMMYSIMNQPNITPDEVTDILVNYDPMWFSLAETMYRKAQEYNTFAYTNELPMDYYGPSTHAYERARACADLLNSVGSFMSRFNSWVAIGNNSRQTARLRARQLKELELHLPEIGAFYDKVESLLNMCMESRPAPATSRKIYNFGMKGRRPRKGRKLRYAIEREDDEKNAIDQFTDWITGVLFDQLMDNDNGYIENIDENVYDKLVNADEQEDIPKRWTAVTNRDICIGNPFSFYGTLNKAIVELDKHLKRCADNPNELGTFDYWINRLKTPTAIRGLIYSNMRPVVASGASLDDMYTYADEKFTMESITNMLYEMIRHLYTTEDLIRLV